MRKFIIIGLLGIAMIGGDFYLNKDSLFKNIKEQEENIIVTQDKAVYEKEFSEEAFLPQITYHLKCLDECFTETYTADSTYAEDWSAGYIDETHYPGYIDEASYDDGMGDPDILYQQGDEENYPDYILTLISKTYYPVKNYRSIDEVKNHLEKYISRDILESFELEDDFYEYNNTLYIVRGDRGYGARRVDIDSAEFVGVENGVYTVKIDILLFDEIEHSEVVGFENIDGNWILTEFQKNKYN